MNITKIGIGEYRNVASAIDLAEICDDVSRLIEYFRTDIFHDFAAMREVLYQCEPTRRIWSARKCGTHYIDVKPDSMAGNVIDCYITEYGTKSEVQTMAHAWVRGWHMATDR